MDRERMEELLSAYLDDELEGHERDAVTRFLAQDARARQLLEELRMTANLVSALPRHSAPESIVADVQSQIERQALLGDEPAAAVSHGQGRRTLFVFLSLAAMLAIMIPMGWYLAAQSSKKLVRNMLAKTDGGIEEMRSADDRSSGDAGHALTAQRTGREVRTSPTPRKDGRTSADTGIKPDAETSLASPRSTATQSLAEAEPPTFEQKLARGAAPVTLRQHAYDAEPVQLQVVVRDEKDRDALVARLASRLSENQVANLADAVAAHQVGVPIEQAVFDLGVPGVNYRNSSHRQLIVRARVKDLNTVFQEIESAGPSNGKVELQVDGHRIRGLESARRNLLTLAQEPTGESSSDGAQIVRTLLKVPVAASHHESEVDEGAASLVSGLLQVIGMDEQSSRALGKRFAESVARRSQRTETGDSVEAGAAFSGDESETEVGLVERSLRRAATASRKKAEEPQNPTRTGDVTATENAAPPKQATDRNDQSEVLVTVVIDIAVEDKPSPRPASAPRPSKPVNDTTKKNN